MSNEDFYTGIFRGAAQALGGWDKVKRLVDNLAAADEARGVKHGAPMRTSVEPARQAADREPEPPSDDAPRWGSGR